MKFPIRYIDNNLIFNHDGECFAYYEFIPFDYGFKSYEKKQELLDNFRQLVAQVKSGKLHALEIATESSISRTQENSKQYAKGVLQDISYARIDGQTESLTSSLGDSQIDYRFFIGFKLMLGEQEVNAKNLL